MSLTDAQIRAALPSEQAYKLWDSDGLFLLVTPTGGKLWRFRYRFDGKDQALALGSYPHVRLVTAREKRDAARDRVECGINPAVERKEQKERANSAAFEDVARDWHEVRKPEWTEKYAAQVLTRLEEDIFPDLGSRPIDEIEPPEMLKVLKKAEARGVLETTRRLKQYCSSIFRFAIASGYCKHDPAAPLKDALKSPPKPVHHKALARNEVGEFLTRLDGYEGEPDTKAAIELAFLTVTRTTELRAGGWRELENLDDPDRALWRIPKERMKMDEEHLVPLSRQAVAVFQRLHKLTGSSPLFFPSDTMEGYISNNTMLFGIYRLGYRGRATTHGFRRTFSTEANEHGFNEDWVERQLAHDERDRVRAAYNAAQYLPQRRRLMQWWADHLDGLKFKHQGRSAPTPPAALASGQPPPSLTVSYRFETTGGLSVGIPSLAALRKPHG